MEFSQWLHYQQFPLEDVVLYLNWAMEILMVMKPTRGGPELEPEQKPGPEGEGLRLFASPRPPLSGLRALVQPCPILARGTRLHGEHQSVCPVQVSQEMASGGWGRP